MTDDRERQLITQIYLLQKENECLRSVLSEWEQDKSCYVQFNRADAFRQAIECLEHGL